MYHVPTRVSNSKSSLEGAPPNPAPLAPPGSPGAWCSAVLARARRSAERTRSGDALRARSDETRAVRTRVLSRPASRRHARTTGAHAAHAVRSRMQPRDHAPNKAQGCRRVAARAGAVRESRSSVVRSASCAVHSTWGAGQADHAGQAWPLECSAQKRHCTSAKRHRM